MRGHSESTLNGNHDSQAELIDASSLGELTRAEVDMQIATAKRFPRSVSNFIEEAKSLVVLSEEIAGDCMYALPRGGKTITGPTARLAEIVASCWGNCKAGARVVSEERGFIVAQGVFYDLERNVAITYEVKRRITDKHGKRYNDDMIAVTANAACSIALRNAVFKGVPKAFWSMIYDEARRCAVGDVETLGSKRAKMMGVFNKMGVKESQVFAVVQVKGVDDIGLDELAILRGIYTAIKDGETTIEQAFAAEQEKSSDKDEDVLKVDDENAELAADLRRSLEQRIDDIESPEESTDIAAEIDEANRANALDMKAIRALQKRLAEKVKSFSDQPDSFDLKS